MSIWEGLIDSLNTLCPGDAQNELAVYRSVLADLESCTTWQSVLHSLHHELTSGRLVSERSSHAFWSNQKVDYLSSPTLDGLVYGHHVALSRKSDAQTYNHAFKVPAEVFTEESILLVQRGHYIVPDQSLCWQLEMETAFVIGVIRSGKTHSLRFLMDRDLTLNQVAYARKFAILSCSKPMCDLVFSHTKECDVSHQLATSIENMKQLDFVMDHGYLNSYGYMNLLDFAHESLLHDMKVWSEFVSKVLDHMSPVRRGCARVWLIFRASFDRAFMDVLTRVMPIMNSDDGITYLVNHVSDYSQQPMASMHYLVHCKILRREHLAQIMPGTPEIVRMMCRAKVPFSPYMIIRLLRAKRTEAAKTLISNLKGLDQYEPESTDANLFVMAILRKEPSLIRLLLKRGARTSVRGYEAYHKYHAMPGYKKLAKMVAPPSNCQ